MIPAVRVIVDGEFVSTWGEFVAVNAELDADELQAISDSLENEGRYDGGGGASAFFTVEIAK